jgi:hypothetical protein
VKEISFMQSAPVYIEIRQTALLAFRENVGVELPLERGANRRLTEGCKQKLIPALQKFLDRKTWQSRAKAFCAINANGVSVRRLTLPVSGGQDFQRLLLLQIESEFPLAPEELAWGWRKIGTPRGGQQEVLLAAVRKEVVEDYATLLLTCGVTPVFTLSALARSPLCPQTLDGVAILDVGWEQLELATFANGALASVRTILAAQGIPAILKALGANGSEKNIFLTGTNEELASQIARQRPSCEPLKIESGSGRSAATLGLKKAAEQNGGTLPLILQVKAREPKGSFNLSQPEIRKWALRTAVLLCALLLLPYAEALLLKPFLAKKISRLNADKGRLAIIDRELEFLQYQKQNQPPYLDALYVVSKSAPQGAKIDSLMMNRRGDVSMRGSMRDAAQVTDFRTKLIGTGFFATVAVEEQTPTPDRQKLNVRITAQLKPAAARVALNIGPTAEEIEKAKKGGGDLPGGGSFPPGMMPGGMPPGVVMPPGAMPSGVVMPPGAMPGEPPSSRLPRK